MVNLRQLLVTEGQSRRQMSILWTQSNYFSVNSATDQIDKQHKNICNQSHTLTSVDLTIFDWDPK